MPKFLDIWTRWLPALPETENDGKGGNAQERKSLLTPAAGRGLAALVLIGALLMLLTRPANQPQQVVGQVNDTPSSVATTQVGPEDKTARELQTILGQIDGVGTVQVYVSLDTGPEQVIAEEVTTQKTTSNGSSPGTTTSDDRETHRPVTIRDDAARTERPLVIVQKEPRVRGVVVVADGAASPRIRYALSQAVQVALGVPAHRVAVFPRD